MKSVLVEDLGGEELQRDSDVFGARQMEASSGKNL